MPISANEAAAIISQKERELSNSRKLPPTLERIRVLMQEEYVLICNVGPWPQKIERGQFYFHVPGYDAAKDPDKKGYSQSAPIPSIFRHAYVANEDNYGYFEDDGRQVAWEAIGVGFGMNPMNSLVPEGLFVPEGKEPTATEINKARKALSDYFDKLIAEARDAYDKGPTERAAVIGDRHLLAAHSRGLDEKWVHHQHTQESVRCEMCGKFNPQGVAKCQCGTILDFELYQKIEAHQQKMMDRMKPSRPVSPPLK